MTRGSRFPIVPPLEDPKSAFHIKKDKKIGESSRTFQTNNFESFEKTPDKKRIGYELETETEDNSEDEIKRVVEEIADISNELLSRSSRKG